MLENYRPRRPPFRHQETALELGWEREGFGYLMEMGLGKSRVLVDNVCMLYNAGRIDGLIVVAPKGVYTNWSRTDPVEPGEFQKWLWDGVRETAQVYTWRSGPSKKEAGLHARLLSATPGLKVLVVNAEALSVKREAYQLCKKFVRVHRALVAVDESTLMQDHTSKRSEVLLELRNSAAYRRILTGSPMTGSPTSLFAQFEFLRPGALGHRSYYTFRERFCVLREFVVSGRTIRSEVGVKNLDELSALVDRHSYRARKKDCLDLPPKVYLRHEVEMTEEQEHHYRELKRHAMTTFETGEEVTTSIALTQILRLHQVVCGHVKSDSGETVRIRSNRTRDLMAILRETEAQAIVWVNYQENIREVVKALRDEYGDDSVAEWWGETPMNLREQGESDFQAGRRRFMVSSQQSGGLGRTWTAATLVVYYSNHPSLLLRQQSEDRPHRIGQDQTVTYIDMITPGTVDQGIVDTLRASEDVARRVMRDGPSAWLA